jgi:C4-dicarboxylate transporter DctM subunit
MVTYCVLANTSVSTLFLAGVGPGLLMGLAMMVVAYLYAKKNNVPVIKEKKSPKEVLHICLDSMWALIMPVIILGGIYSGIFTPTEEQWQPYMGWWWDYLYIRNLSGVIFQRWCVIQPWQLRSSC